MDVYGFCGRIVHVDLTTGKTEARSLDLSMARDFIGGFGVDARLAYDLLEPGIDPLSPANVIMVGAGPLVGTPVPAASRFTVLTKYPLTGAVAFASAGMELGRRLKYAGYDHLIITGKAERPVYLKIFDDSVELCDASGLWGKDIIQATDELWDKHGKQYSVMAIGQAGENLVKLALALVDRVSSAGKGGLAAVMGSKNLKAVVAGGSHPVKVYDPKRLKEPTKQSMKAFRSDPARGDYMDSPEALKHVGKIAWFDKTIAKMGGSLVKNWTEMAPAAELIERYGSRAYLERLNRWQTGCYGCPHKCKDIVEVKDGEFKGLTLHISSPPGRMRDLGVRCMAGSVERAVKLMEIANRYGICIHVFAPLMDFAVDLFERGIITGADTGGMALRRDFETAARLMEQTAFKQGIGEVLADGARGIFRQFGRECEQYSVHVKGLEPHGDPREKRFTMESFAQMVNPEGATQQPAHTGSFRVGKDFDPQRVREYCQRLDLPNDATERILNVDFGYNVARLTKWGEDFYAGMTCLGICNHRSDMVDFRQFAEMYSGATGIEISYTEFQQASERVWNTFKALNVREGFGRKDDRIPPKWLQPFKGVNGEEIPPMGTEGKPVSAADAEKLLDDYYDERGWLPDRGIPSTGKLISLGLKEIADDLQNRGILSNHR